MGRSATISRGAAAPVSLNHDGRISCDWYCVECGYNLRTLLLAAACPECGHAISDSLPLSCQPAAWLRRLREGALLLTLGLVVWTGTLAIRLDSLRLPGRVGETLGPPNAPGIAQALVSGAGPAIAILGARLLTTPHGPNAARRARFGRHVRLACCAGLSVLVLRVLLGPWTVWPRPYYFRLQLALEALSIAVFAVAFVTLLRYAEALLRSAPGRWRVHFVRLLLYLSLALFVANGLNSLFTIAQALHFPPIRVPFSFPVWRQGENTPPEYIIVNADGSRTRTSTVPAELPLPPAPTPMNPIPGSDLVFHARPLLARIWLGGTFILGLMLCWTVQSALRRQAASKRAEVREVDS